VQHPVFSRRSFLVAPLGAEGLAVVREHSCGPPEREPARAYSFLPGEPSAGGKGFFEGAEVVGGVKYYLVKEEGGRFFE